MVEKFKRDLKKVETQAMQIWEGHSNAGRVSCQADVEARGGCAACVRIGGEAGA